MNQLETASEVEVRTGSASDLDSLAREWRSLCSRAANDEPFYRPEWLQTWLRAFMPNSPVTVLTARENGRLTGLLPLAFQWTQIAGLPARQASSPTNHHSCRFDLLREAGPGGDAAIRSIWLSLNQISRWDCLRFSYVPEDGSLTTLRDLAAAGHCPVWTRPTKRSPFVVTEGWDGSPDFWLRQTTTHFNRNIRRLTRKCAATTPIRLERIDTADPAALAKFYEVEGAGWKGQSGTGILSRPATHQFYNEIARVSAQYGYGALYLLYLDEKLAAGHFGFQYNGKHLTAKCAFDERLKTLAPGHLIVNAILQDCAGSHLREFEFGGDDEEWKMKWTSHTHPHETIFIFRNTPYGHLLHNARSKLVPAAGRVLRRLASAVRVNGLGESKVRTEEEP